MNVKSAVLTFDKHPFSILRPDEDIKLITDNKVKSHIIDSLGVDYLLYAVFDRDFASMEAQDFIKILKDSLNAKILLCGYNYSFGKEGRGNVSLLRKYSNILDYDLKVLERITLNNHIVSSTSIRRKLEAGKIPDANVLLGYRYFCLGRVTQGKRLGNKLGFATANIEISDNLCIRNGVYITSTTINGETYPSISNVGYSPTIKSDKRVIETHIFNYSSDIYNEEIKVEFFDFIRDEKKFNSLDELKERVNKDIKITMKFFQSNNIYNR
jgi:riboflavin kinase/FMN adenylyltransferase